MCVAVINLGGSFAFVRVRAISHLAQMAEYMRRYRKALKEAHQWMRDDAELHLPCDDSVQMLVFDGNYIGKDSSGHDDNELEHDDSCLSEVDENNSGYDEVMDVSEPPISSSEDDHEEFSAPSDSLKNELAQFMVSANMTRDNCNTLLAILRKHGMQLPKDCRTLRKTPRSVEVQSKCGGQYVYFGIKKALQMVELDDEYKVNINVDGVPLYKSSSTQFWPILCQINSSKPIIVALFLGTCKPDSVSEYLSDFVLEMTELQSCGFAPRADMQPVPVVLRAVICDAPARAFIKNTKAHNSLHGCERCTALGKSVNNRTTFSSPDCFHAEKRRHDKFVNMEYLGSHQSGPTPLSSVLSNCIESCALDYMHLVCLGVVRRMIHFWKSGDKIVRLSSGQVSQISEKLVALKDFIPSDFARRPRSLVELDRWKATELRMFLLYTGPVVLKGVLSPELYKHFLSLTVSISILVLGNAEKRQQLLQYACRLLHHFVTNSDTMYGENFLVYNVHNLLHLADDVQFFDTSLDGISAFPFENFLRTLKRFVRSTSVSAIAQVVKRIQELEATTVSSSASTCTSSACLKLSTSCRDCMILLKSGRYGQIIAKVDDRLVVSIYRKSCMDLFFTKPCPSDLLDITFVRRSSEKRSVVEILYADIQCKALRLPHGDGHVFIPMLHIE